MLVDYDVVRRAQSGDAAAFNELAIAYRKKILGTVFRLIGRREDVEDVGQEVFLRLYYSLEQLRTPEVFEPWLYRLTVNAAYDYLRKQRRRESRMADLSEEQVLAADAAASSQQALEEKQKVQIRETVGLLLDGVSEEDRILLTLKEVQGLSVKELKSIYRIRENALKVRLFRARRRVLRAFREMEDKEQKLKAFCQRQGT